MRDAVDNGTDDLVLRNLVDLTVRAEVTERMLFDNPLHEPIFYERYFRPWVKSALEEKAALDKFHNEALASLGRE